MQRLNGIAITRGTATGRAVLLVHRGQAVRFPVPADRVEDEVSRLHAAADQSRQQLEAIRARIRHGRASDLTALFDAQLLMLDDPMLMGRAGELVRRERVNAEWALQRVLEEVDAIFDTIEDPYLRERKGDIGDVIGRVRMNLRQGGGAPRDLLREVEGPFILVADELSPSVAAQIDWGRVRGFAMDAGSRTYHTAILARSLQIPAIVGLHDATRRVTAGTQVAIDGATGELIIEPTDEVLASLQESDAAADTPPASNVLRGPSETLDGVRIRLEANVDLLDDISLARAHGAEGIGLFRSEFMLRGDLDEAGEERQYEVYRQLAAAMAPHPVTIRTFDLDEQKAGGAARLTGGREGRRSDGTQRSPLGLRGIRLSLVRQDVLRRQVRAVLRASREGNLRLLVPFITSVDEVRLARSIMVEEARSLGFESAAANVPLGAMIEVPSAAITADLLASEVDFLAIGTNDLIQYTLAVDRTDERVSDLYQPLHPGLLRLLRAVRRAAARTGKQLSVCGEMASDPALLAVLVGLGLREFSMTPTAIPAARQLISAVRARDLTNVASHVLRIGTVEEIETYLDAALGGMREGVTQK